MGLAQVLPLPGKFGGYVIGTDKDPVMITLLAGEDSTRKTPPAATPELPKRSGDIGVAFSEGQGLTREQFAERYGLQARAVQEWKQGRRKPEPAVRAYMLVIKNQPGAVRKALTAA
jgi:DNA-binding transcriptional regulator YiaG